MRLYIVGDTQSTKCKVFTTQREAEIYVAEELRANEFNGLWYEYLKYIQEYNGPMDEINDFRDFLWNKFINNIYFCNDIWWSFRLNKR